MSKLQLDLILWDFKVFGNKVSSATPFHFPDLFLEVKILAAIYIQHT